MKRVFTTALCTSIMLPALAQAEGFEFKQSGMLGGYYGIMETRDLHNIDNMANRMVYRQDGNFEAAYGFSDSTKVALKADYTIVFRQHDKDYSEGDWRFYPYLSIDDSRYGKFTYGYTYNAAFLLHQGAQEISWLGIQDSNLPYYLSSANWVNGLSSVGFSTPKSTKMMDDGRAPKFSYFTPKLKNTTLGFSYTPDNDSRRGMVSRYAKYEKKQDGYTVGMLNEWEPGLGKFYTSAAYGLFNRTDNEWAVGARWEIGKFNINASYKNAYVDGNKNPITTKSTNPHLKDYFDNYREGESWDFSMGYDFGKFKTNIAYLHTEAKNTRHRDDLFVQTNRYELNKYIELFWINAYLNSKGATRDSNGNNKGYAVITGIALKY